MTFYFKKYLINIVVFILVILALSLWGFYWAIHPLKILSSVTPQNFGVTFENVEFLTSDNVMIRGWFIPNANPKAKTIILLHGYPADKGDILPSRIFLHEKYHLLFIDFRYLGESGGKRSTVGQNEILDAIAAIHYLQKRGLHEIGIWGFSLGGAVALMSVKNQADVKAIIAESSYASLDKMAADYFRIPLLKYPLGELLRLWGWIFLDTDIKKISPVESALQLNIPILIIHSKNDDVISFEHAEIFQKKLKNKSNIEFLVIENLHHGQSFKDYQKTISEFFDKSFARQ